MGNVQKLRRYLMRNGLKNTYYAARERLLETKGASYSYSEPVEEILNQQREASKNSPIRISVVVPVYETPERFLRELIESLLSQSYSNWELVLADASKSDAPADIIGEYDDSRIVYARLTDNAGISANTNQALKYAGGDYIALTDHDDLLTKDALFEVAAAILKAKARGVDPAFVYSDEDKCDGDGKTFFEPNIKPKFNFDYLTSNNYICHLSVIKSDLFEKYAFRPEFDGAQDHDLFIRITGDLKKAGEENRIIHISKVLYHWRCHEASTSSNTDSKNYAYEAGRNCVADYLGTEVKDSLHKGFYVPNYGVNLFLIRKDVGAVGGFVTDKNKIIGGIYDEEGNCPYEGMNCHFSGYLHRAHCIQEADVLDIRNLIPRPEFAALHAEALYGMQLELRDLSDSDYEKKKEVYKKWNRFFAEKIKNAGRILLFDPKFTPGTEMLREKKTDILPISVVIPNYNGLSYLKPCIDSVLASTKQPEEIIIVDNASSDGSGEYISENFPGVKLIVHNENLGFTGAVNHGIVASSGKYIFLLNNDTTVEPDCIEKLYDAISNDEKIFSAGALMLSMDNPEIVDNAGDSYNILGYPRSFASAKSKVNYFGDKSAKVFTSCAGAAMYDADILRRIGLFDDRHFAYFEDVDLGYRARIYGYKNINVRNAVVYHKGSAVSGSKHNAFKVNLSSQNSVLVPMKNMPLIQYIVNLPFLITGVIIKMLFFALKGYGGVYIKGIFRGISMSLGKEGRKHHVKFRFSSIKYYILIQLWMIKALFAGN